ncbi:hypothetical protein ACLOJK_015498 [Asimina triloba]
MRRKKSSSSIFDRFLLFCLFVFIFLVGDPFLRSAAAGKRRIHIPDDLHDVIDDEEDEAWKEWGKKPKPKEFDPPPDFSEMEPAQIQAEMLKRHTGPLIGFVKLRLGVQRSRQVVAETAMKWTRVLRTGAAAVRFMGVDTNTIMFNMEEGQDVEEHASSNPLWQFDDIQMMDDSEMEIKVKEFILNHPEAYEIKIGDQVFRRPGDPPLEEVIDKLQRQKEASEAHNSVEEPEHPKDEF